MKLPKKGPIREEWLEISDADMPPETCPNCNSKNYRRLSYRIRILQELGSPSVARRVRYELVTWQCKKCEVSFTLHNPEIPSRSQCMPDVIEYARRRVLSRGDSAGRVANDLKDLHQVDISDDAILNWIYLQEDPPEISKNQNNNQYRDEIGGDRMQEFQSQELPTSFTPIQELPNFSGVFGIDGTFKSVKAKKKRMHEEENEPLFLHLTYLPDGRLAAYWHEGKMKKKP